MGYLLFKTKVWCLMEGPGRPSEFTPELSAKIVELYWKGKTLYQISKIVEVSERTLYQWKKDHKEFSHALNEAKQAANERVERSLYRRARGYYYEEEVATKDGTRWVKRYLPPDVGAQKMWLTNRTKDWKVTENHNHTHYRNEDWDKLLQGISDDEITNSLKEPA